MRVLVLFGLGLIASVSASVGVETSYHDTIGIPLAAKIKAEEEQQSELPYEERIVGGALAPVGSHPYFAGLWIDLINVAGNSVCGSTLLTANRLVTAAHCWRDRTRQAWRFTVLLGSKSLSNRENSISTTNIITHPQYNNQYFHNDVAMIYLPRNVVFTATIQPAALPSTSYMGNTFVGQYAVAAGFGKTSDQQNAASWVASHVTLQVISNQVCSTRFPYNYVVSSTICTSGTGGVGICGGDSGGPLVLLNNGRPTLIGISSFVSGHGCQFGDPAAYGRVTSFLGFIKQHL